MSVTVRILAREGPNRLARCAYCELVAPPLTTSFAAKRRTFNADWPLVVRLRGGVGNQLFQWAAACSIAEPSAIRAVRSSTLDQLSIEALLPGVLRFTEPPPAGIFDRLISRKWTSRRAAASVAAAARPFRPHATYSQRGRLEWAYEPRPARFAPPRLLDGYFQHPSWSTPGCDLVVDELLKHAPEHFAQLRALGSFGAVCIRRGDYERLGMTLPPSYYDHALAALPPSLPLVLVGDDDSHLRTLREQLIDCGRTVLQPAPIARDPAVNDFWMTAAATNVVMANSTFSWWATTVGDRCHSDDGHRSVFFPSRWVNGHGAELRAAAWVSVASG